MFGDWYKLTVKSLLVLSLVVVVIIVYETHDTLRIVVVECFKFSTDDVTNGFEGSWELDWLENVTIATTTTTTTTTTKTTTRYLPSPGDEACARQFLAGYNVYCETSLKPKLSNVKNSKFLLADGTLNKTGVCPCVTDRMTGRILPNLDPPPIAEMVKHFPEVEMGGRWSPSWCAARHRIAIIVPYAKREKQLQVFLFHMHTILQRQLIDYTILVVEQREPEVFNKGSLMNIGFVEAAAMADFDCFVCHDVDQYPIDDRNIYTCSKDIRHLVPYRQKLNYELNYYTFFGGGTAFSNGQYRQINGFSNQFFGWGAEDNDIIARINAKRLPFVRYPRCISKYNSIEHSGPKSHSKLKSNGRPLQTNFDRVDGVNSLKYTKLDVKKLELYTILSIALPRPPHLIPDGMSDGGNKTKLEGEW